jgi:filamentous hemagglutinin family protein
VSWLVIGGAIASWENCAYAQITPDSTLTNNSIVTPSGNTRTIEGGTRAGSNLFHSFEQFSVPTGSTADFNNALDIQNIISRVTGKFISNIDGLIKANGSANLFLINPNGIIFGPNARLNIGGSFVGSTASSLKFADGNQFSATAPQTTPLLTVSVPLGLQFGPTAGSIVNQSRSTNISGEPVGLQMQPGKTLALVGGNVRLEGATMLAPGGRVELGGLAGSGTVEFVDSNNLRLSFPDSIERADVALTNRTFVGVAAGGGGSIAINARNIDVLGGSYLFAGISSGLGSETAVAGDVTLNATGAIALKQSSNIINEVNPKATGNSGNIDIKAESLNLENAFLSASTFGVGNGGTININARDRVSFTGRGAYSQVEPEAVGNSGGINITTGSLFLTNSELLAHTKGKGNAGTININARDTISLDQSSKVLSEAIKKQAVGNSGGININTGSLFLTDGSFLAASTFGVGNGGSINIDARDTVSFSGGRGAYSQVEPEAIGNSGGININTGSLSLTDGAVLRADTRGKGNAGTININARDTVSFARSFVLSEVASRDAMGNSGGINVTTGALSLTDGAVLATSTFGVGNGGSK